MFAYLKLLHYYKLASFKWLFKLTAPVNAYNESIKTNFGHQTFRFPKKATSDWLISAKIYKTLFFGQFKWQKFVIDNTATAVAIFDGNLYAAEKRRNYVKRLSDDSVKLVLGRSELVNSPTVFISCINVLSLILSFPFSFFISVLSSNKLRYPLHILNTFEAFNVLYLLRKHKISKLHFFYIYENDTNLMAYTLMKSGITINKIPSEVPLSFWNKTVVADTLSLCFRYQEDEYNLCKATMFVKELNHWVPENSFELENTYKGKNHTVKAGTIGFYSSAMWLREKLGRIDLKDNAYLNEQGLLKYLLNFVEVNSKYKVVVFLHPLEKKDLTATKTYYGELSQNIELANLNVPNAEQFFNAEVGVTLFSTLSYERLFWGYKTLIYPLGHDDFPIKNSNFNNICAKSEGELGTKLLATLEVGNDEFFVKNALINYRYSDYKVFKN